MKNKPKVSVIVPIYRTEKYLHRCLNSIVSQTYQDFEAILVDDGSDDNCPSICDKYARNYPHVFRAIHQNNKGLSSARNIGIKQAIGKFIAFIDSDDYVSPTFLEDFINGQKLHNADLTICSYKKESQNHTESCIFKPTSIEKGQLHKLITEHNLLPQCYTWNKLFKKEIIEKNNLLFERKVSLAEDAIFLYQYLLHIKNIELIDKENYYYQIHIRGDSLMNIKRTFTERLDIYNCYYLQIKKLEQLLNNKEVAQTIGIYLSRMIDRQILSIYTNHNPHHIRIKQLKQIDLKTYSLYRKGWTIKDSILIWLLTHKFYKIYDLFMNLITQQYE